MAAGDHDTGAEAPETGYPPTLGTPYRQAPLRVATEASLAPLSPLTHEALRKLLKDWMGGGVSILPDLAEQVLEVVPFVQKEAVRIATETATTGGEDASSRHLSLTHHGTLTQAFPVLSERRPLSPSDLSPPLMIAASYEAEGALSHEPLADDPVARKALDAHEIPPDRRVLRQQCLRVVALGYKVQLEYCGQRLSLTAMGLPLRVWADRTHLQRHVRLFWLASFISTGLYAGWTYLWVHTEPLYDAPNRVWLALTIGGIVALPYACAGLLRAWRPGFRRWPLGLLEKVALVWTVAMFLAGPVIHCAMHPTVAAARRSIREGRSDRAVQIIERLEATTSGVESSEVSELRRLLQRNDRLAQLRHWLQRHEPDAVHSLVHTWRMQGLADPAVLAMEAEAWEVDLVHCGQRDTCRVRYARLANRDSPTPARLARLTALRTRVLTALNDRTLPTDPLVRYAWLQQRRAAALDVQRDLDDLEIQAASRGAVQWTQNERYRIPLLGSTPSIVDDILHPAPESRPYWAPPIMDFEVIPTFVDDHCVALTISDAHLPKATNEPNLHRQLERLLTQAIGPHEVTLPMAVPTSPNQTVTVYAAHHPVVLRWVRSRLVEFRIGSVHP